MKRLILMGPVAALLALSGGDSFAGQCAGGAAGPNNVLVRNLFTINQDESVVMNDLHFKAWQKECWAELKQWAIDVDDFTTVGCVAGLQPASHQCADDSLGKHAVDVTASVGSVPIGDSTNVNVNFWLTRGNAIRLADVKWTQDATEFPTVPDFGWSVSAGTYVGANVTRHTITLWNDSNVAIHFLDFDVAASQTQILTLSHDDPIFTILPDLYVPTDFTVGAGSSVDIVFDAANSGIGTYLYLTFWVDADGVPGAEELRATAEHFIWAVDIPTVTGWGVAVMALLVATAGTIVVVQRSRRVAA